MQIKVVSGRLGGLGSKISALRRKQSQNKTTEAGKALASESGDVLSCSHMHHGVPCTYMCTVTLKSKCHFRFLKVKLLNFKYLVFWSSLAN